LTFADGIVERFGKGQENLLEILQAIQDEYGYLPKQVLERVCELTAISPASIMGVSSFYDRFRHSPAGKYTVRICIGTACHVKGAGLVYDAFQRYLDIGPDEDTDADGLFTLEKVACLGCCTLAPAVQIGEVIYGHLTTDAVSEVLSNFLRYEESKASQPREKHKAVGNGADYEGEIRLGFGTCCIAKGSGQIRAALDDVLEQTGIKVRVKRVGCLGMCYQEPLLEVVLPDNTSFLYTRVRPEDARAIVTRHFKARGITGRVSNAAVQVLDSILTDEGTGDLKRYSIGVRDEQVADFLGKQKHITTEHFGSIDPTDIDEYLANGGFTALRKCLTELGCEQVIEEIRYSGLRGRGGAGFHTGMKWAAVRASEANTKYVVCNGDEGDPGAFMDRMIMESYPYRILEGIAIAAYAVGAGEGRFYIRAEYPLAYKRVAEAIEKCRRNGFLGEGILGTDFTLEIKLVPGAGAFVCGEETALLASIEGRRGMPRLRPPYPAEHGLWGKPTLINNVETYATVPWIIRNSAQAFAKLGTGTSKGTKAFALAGKIAHGGLIEVPMGITIREIIEDIGGGIAGGERFKAVQVGGPSGGCIPAELGHIAVDYESLAEAGTMMGSGGMVVLDESDCMVDIARYFLQFTQNQSCGKCTFCRIGTRRMLDILNRLCGGEGRRGDIEELERLAAVIKKGSLCGLGRTAPNPVLSTIRYFRDEYEAHIQGRCPAGGCKALITYSITDDCIGCTICAQHCPVEAIEMKPYEKHEIDTDKCIRCGTCKSVCPADAVKVE